MKIIFISLVKINSLKDGGIYSDLLKVFHSKGHDVCIVGPSERRNKEKTNLKSEERLKILTVSTYNIQKTNLFEKAISTLTVSYKFKKAIIEFLPGIKFDLIIYTTPPITFVNLIYFLKKKNNAKTYLLLKDIFPQNAVDLGMIKQNGIIHRYFEKKEKELYKISDHIGCMSPANKTYLKNKNRYLKSIIEVNPNSIIVNQGKKARSVERSHFNIPDSALVMIFGGNIGKPQGVGFIEKVLDSNKSNSELFFLIIGSGTDYNRLYYYIKSHKIQNVKISSFVPLKEYERLVSCADVGLIFLSDQFTIPNFPSRILGYLNSKIPVIICSDEVSDMGPIAEKNKFGFFVKSGDVDTFNNKVNYFLKNKEQIIKMGEEGFNYLKNNYSARISYSIIMNHFN